MNTLPCIVGARVLRTMSQQSTDVFILPPPLVGGIFFGISYRWVALVGLVGRATHLVKFGLVRGLVSRGSATFLCKGL